MNYVVSNKLWMICIYLITYIFRTEYSKAYSFGPIGSLHTTNLELERTRPRVYLNSAKEGIHLFRTICFEGVLFMSPSSSSDFNFLLFSLCKTSVVHFLLLNLKEKN